MKKIILIVFIVLNFASVYSQQAKGYVVKDLKKNKIYYLKAGTEMEIETIDSTFTGNLDSISDKKLFVNKKVVDFDKLNFIAFKDYNKIKDVRKITWKMFLAGILATVVGYLLTFAGLALAFVLTILGFLLLFLLIPALIYLFILSVSKTKIFFKN